MPPVDGMTDEARSRIEAIERHTELGSGFQIASLDLKPASSRSKRWAIFEAARSPRCSARRATRGLKPNRSRLFIIDGSKGLRAAIRGVFGKRTLLQRCQVHKARNVVGHLPEAMHADVRAAIRAAYKCSKVDTAKRLLNNLARTLEKKHPSAAASLREGLDETLTVMGLGLSASLTRSLSTTNPIENMNERIRTTARRVKRWDGGTMILRWVLVGVLEAARGFRRLKGHKDMRTLVAKLTQHADATAHPTIDAPAVAA